MECFHQNLDISRKLLAILDGIRSLPNARSEHEILSNMVRSIKGEIESVEASINETNQLIELQKDLMDGWDDLENHLHECVARQQPSASQETPTFDSGSRQRRSRSDSARFLRRLHGPLGDDSSCSFEPLENSDANGLQTSVMSSLSYRSTKPTHLMDVTNSQRFHGSSQWLLASSSTPLPSTGRAISPAPSFCSSHGETPRPRKNLEASISYISKSDFNNIPQYMRGRITYDEINAMVDKYNDILNKKLMIVKKNVSTKTKATKTKSDMDLLLRWKEQSTLELQGQYFVTAEDFASLSDYKLSKKDFNILTMLRHVKKIREVRNRKITFYVAVF